MKRRRGESGGGAGCRRRAFLLVVGGCRAATAAAAAAADAAAISAAGAEEDAVADACGDGGDRLALALVRLLRVLWRHRSLLQLQLAELPLLLLRDDVEHVRVQLSAGEAHWSCCEGPKKGGGNRQERPRGERKRFRS